MIPRSILLTTLRLLVLTTLISVWGYATLGQSLTAGTVTGVILDPNKAEVPNATVTIENAVTGYKRTVNTESDGMFRFDNIPLNNYTLTVSAFGFTGAHISVSVRSSVPTNTTIPLTVGETTETVPITGGELMENVPSAHTDVDKTLIDRLPVRDPGSGLSSIVTLSAPGVAADSNGGPHPLGDHFQSQLVLDGQAITDQQSKVFSTQIPVNIVQSLDTTSLQPSEYK